jgi:hypothetical protein
MIAVSAKSRQAQEHKASPFGMIEDVISEAVPAEHLKDGMNSNHRRPETWSSSGPLTTGDSSPMGAARGYEMKHLQHLLGLVRGNICWAASVGSFL